MSTPQQAQGDVEDTGLRKAIRCDKVYPCANCRAARRSCTSNAAGQRPKEARSRVLISSQYERKIDQIDSRLSNIESLLRGLPSVSQQPYQPHGAPPRRDLAPVGNSTGPSTSPATDDDSSDESGYGGDTGLIPHTEFASKFLEGAVEKTSLREASPKIQAALANLRQLVEMQTHRSISHGPRFPLAVPMPPGGASSLPKPPIEVVTALLKLEKKDSPTLQNIVGMFSGTPDLTPLCRDVYFPTEEHSDARYIMVNAGLGNVFMEQLALTKDPALKAEYESYCRMCSSNIETLLANLPLFLSPKVETVQALLVGAMYAIDVARPSVAWHLISTAAQLVQTGGYHRQECLRTDPPDVVQIKNILFWNVYVTEKNLGLRLGRASAIRDCDINIPREYNYSGFLFFDGSPYPNLWIRVAGLQGRIYEELYSPAALGQPQAALAAKARELGQECQRLQDAAVYARARQAQMWNHVKPNDFVEALLRGDEVQFFVTVTLVYRVIPAPEGSPTRFCIECLESARQAVRTHQASAHLMGISDLLDSIYVHWNLLVTPFAPFFVLFCYVIETSSAEDVEILSDFVGTLEQAQAASETVGKLYRLCHVMLDAAKLYLEAKSQQQDDQNMVSIGDEFEMYLGQLGFLPAEDEASAERHAGGMLGGRGDAAQLAEWYSGNRNMIDLLEADLTHIDPAAWMPQGSR